jgi:hypothetical protein
MPIAGKVSGVAPSQVQIVIYAHTDHWYVEPDINSPITSIGPDGGWENVTHPGQEYRVLLVKKGFHPTNVADVLPGVGGDVLAIAH